VAPTRYQCTYLHRNADELGTVFTNNA